MFGGGRRAEHHDVGNGPTELERRESHAASRHVDEHARAWSQLRDAKQHVVRGDVHDGECCPLFEWHRLGHRARLKRWHAHSLRVPAKPCYGDDPRTFAWLGHTFPERVDDARNFVTDDAWRFRRVRVKPRARHQLGEIQARGANANANLTRAWHRIGLLPNFEDIRTAVFFDPDCAHARLGSSKSHNERILERTPWGPFLGRT
jgi:hypothetical protein